MMYLIIGVSFLPFGIYLLLIGIKMKKNEQGYPRNSFNMMILGLTIFSMGIAFIYRYFKQ